MEGQKMFVLFCVLVLPGYSLCEETFDTEDKVLPDDVLQDEISEDEISKREIQNATKIFNRLKIELARIASASTKVDMVFVVDESKSVGQSNFNMEKKFVQNLIESFPIFSVETRVAIVSYSTRVMQEFNFIKYMNMADLRKGIQAIRYTGGWTATGKALRYVHNKLIFNAAAGARCDATKVVFVLTDGKSNYGFSPFGPARDLKDRGVITFALGVTKSVEQKELLAIATSLNRVFHVANFATLNKVANALKGVPTKTRRTSQLSIGPKGKRGFKGKLSDKENEKPEQENSLA